MMKTKLGSETLYLEKYDPKLLDFSPRKVSRDQYNNFTWSGSDVWHAFEFSWLDERGSPESGVIRLDVPATSTHIVESKSLKLYLNSFSFERLQSSAVAVETIQSDLAKGLGAVPLVTLFANDAKNLIPTASPKGYCIDNHTLRDPIFDQVTHSLLKTGSDHREELLFSNNFRSLCPVTSQPDWATVVVMYRGQEIIADSLHAYLVSYRRHQGFHEACCEQIFYDIHTTCKTEELSVMCCFTRRGGIDITPIRGNSAGNRMQWMRVLRQ